MIMIFLLLQGNRKKNAFIRRSREFEIFFQNAEAARFQYERPSAAGRILECIGSVFDEGIVYSN